MGAQMLQDVRQDLTDVVHVCEGKKKQTNVLRTLINDLVKGGLQVLLQFLLKTLNTKNVKYIPNQLILCWNAMLL